MHFVISPSYGSITSFQLFPSFELYMKIKIEQHAESPVILILKAESHDKIEDLNIHACWNQLKPNLETKDTNYINISNCNKIIISDPQGKNNFQETKYLYLSLKTSFKDYNMKIKSLMKVKAVKKIQCVGVTNSNED